MAHQILQLPKAALTGSLALKPGWKISLFLTTTTTPTPAYTTSALTTTHTQPVEADAAGIMPAIFLDPAILYKCSVYDQNDVLQYTVDPCNDSVLSQSIIGALLYPATQLEESVGAVLSGNIYPSGDPRRQSSLYPNSAYMDLGDAPTWINSTAPGGSFSVPTDRTAVYVRGRGVRLFGSGGGICDARIVTSSFGGGATTIDVTVADIGGTVPTDLVGVMVADTLPAYGMLRNVLDYAGAAGPLFANTNVSATGVASLTLANLSPDSGVSAAIALRVTSGNFVGKFLNAHGGISGRGIHFHTGFPIAIEIGVGDQPRLRLNTITNPNIMYGSEEGLRLVAYRDSDDLGGAWQSWFRYDETTRKGIFGFASGGTSNRLDLINEEATSDIKIETTRHIILAPGAGSGIYLDAAGSVGIFRGSGSPEGVVTAGVGGEFFRTDGGAGTSHYFKESGSGNTGWVAK